MTGAPEAFKRILAHHTSPQDAGRVFSTAMPRLAVYSHITVAGDAVPFANLSDYITATRETYRGPLEIGKDLMTINIGETVNVERPAKN